MPSSKIQDEQEVLRWFKEGMTYAEMSRIYLEKYNIQTVPSLWSNFRRRRDLPGRFVSDKELIPWRVREEHTKKYTLRMLRVEARVRAGEPVNESDRMKHASFMMHLRDENLVVAYDPESPEGFQLVGRHARDVDVVRPPRLARHARR
jgi:hypothetical protein